MKKREALVHWRKPAGRRSPAIRHKRNRGARRDHARAGAKSPENSQFLVPESCKQERPKQPFRNSQEIGCAADTENRVHPENQGPVADVRNQGLRLIWKPFLISKKEKYEDHRCSD